MSRFTQPNYPTDWAKYRAAADSNSLPPTFPQYTEVNRFGARYKAAKSYRGAKFAGYAGGDTAQGYSRLLALVLAFSAFEYFYDKVLGLDVSGISKLLWNKHRTDMQEFQDEFDCIIKTPETDQLFKAMRPHLNKGYQKSIDDMLSGADTDLIRAFAAIRHAFVHGHLTPNMDNVPPTAVIDLCTAGHKFLLEMMDREFSRQLNPKF